jgi:hypothetical protein
MPTIRVEHADGSTTRLAHFSSHLIREFGKMDMARLFTSRGEVADVSFEKGRDYVYLERDTGRDRFGGMLKDIERDGSLTELVVDSFERLAVDAQPTAQDEHYQNATDQTIVEDAIAAIPGLSAGSIDQLEAGLSFVFPGTTQAKKVRTVEDATAGEVLYRADQTVDYVTRLGSDKSGSVTISPDNQNLEGSLKVTERGGEKKITHLRMLGTGEANHQVTAHIVPEADDTAYENTATYESTWSAGDHESWDSYTNKDIGDAETLQRQGLALIDELNSEFLELKATLVGVDVELGDTVFVEKPKDNIEQALRVVEWTRIDDAEGVRYEVVLSNRQKTREEQDAKVRKDVQRYNKAFEGNPVTMNTSGGRQPVDGDHAYEFEVYYPGEVQYEHRVKLQVKGLNYRAYSKGAAGGGDHTHVVEVAHPEHAHELTVDATSAQVDYESSYVIKRETDLDGNGSVSYTFSNVSSDKDVWASVGGQIDSGTDPVAVFMRIHDGSTTSDELAEVSQTVNTGQSFSGVPAVGGNDRDSSDVTVEIKAVDGNLKDGGIANAEVNLIAVPNHVHAVSETTTSENALGTTESETSDASGEHTHDPDPGIIDVAEYPSNCDVIVNGQSVGVSLGDGSGPFEETVDLAGMLTPGSWNTIQVTSDSLGHAFCHIDIDVYRQILGNG